MNKSARVCEFMSPNSRSKKFIDTKEPIVFAYPQNYARDVAKIMKDIKLSKIPVLLSPWNRRLIGFVEFKKISAFL